MDFPTKFEEPKYEDYFKKVTLLDLLFGLQRKGPYVFLDIYSTFRNTYGFKAHYVNYGYWPDGPDTHEPARELAYLMGELLDLSPGAKLLDAGSGVGGAAVDLCERYDLAGVVGINPCVPQVDFARALVDSHQLSDRIEFKIGDASAVVTELTDHGFTHAMALECITYFSDHLLFLKSVNEFLPTGGKMAFAVGVSNKPQNWAQKRIVKQIVNVQQHTGEYWENLMHQAGYKNVVRRDITSLVLEPFIELAVSKYVKDDNKLQEYNWVLRRLVQAFTAQAWKAVKSGSMGYEVFVGEVP